jgi:cobyrinic acid a,c-diamide synthase
MRATNMPRLLVSAAHKSSGKTTLTLGLAAALAARGLAVQTFKKGPDYIDPMWLARASGRPCVNLDPYLMPDTEIAACFDRHATGAEIALVEGNKGLYDGLALDGSNSNAALARQLGLPVVLVLDARGMTRGIAPLILGYQAFDRELRIAGVILNQVGGSRHEAKLRAVIEHYTDVPVLGAVARDARLAMPERHLGLMPTAEHDDAAAQVRHLGDIVGTQVDLDRLLTAARSAGPRAGAAAASPPRRDAALAAVQPPVRIGIARDRAFAFYYPDDLAALVAAGAQLVPFDTLRDARLPAVDGLFIGGGFPEMFMAELQANVGLRTELREAVDAGLPVYAECGGLMYLARSITWNGRSASMVGAIPGDAVMHERPMGRGYVHLEESAAHPWPAGAVPAALRAHEFHYSSLENLAPDVGFAYRVRRGHGVDGSRDGIVHRNLLASYAHQRGVGGNAWPARFVAFVRKVGAGRRAAAPLPRPDKLAA